MLAVVVGVEDTALDTDNKFWDTVMEPGADVTDIPGPAVNVDDVTEPPVLPMSNSPSSCIGRDPRVVDITTSPGLLAISTPAPAVRVVATGSPVELPIKIFPLYGRASDVRLSAVPADSADMGTLSPLSSFNQ